MRFHVVGRRDRRGTLLSAAAAFAVDDVDGDGDGDDDDDDDDDDGEEQARHWRRFPPRPVAAVAVDVAVKHVAAALA